jgi:hypothetical protein
LTQDARTVGSALRSFQIEHCPSVCSDRFEEFMHELFADRIAKRRIDSLLPDDELSEVYHAATLPNAGSLYDQDPLGGFGGLGIVQLMVPPGTSETSNDGTNTVLDDNIHFFLPNTYQPGTVITYGPGAPAGLQEGVRKEHLLAWRGIHNGTQYVADNGNPVNVSATVTPTHV